MATKKMWLVLSCAGLVLASAIAACGGDEEDENLTGDTGEEGDEGGEEGGEGSGGEGQEGGGSGNEGGEGGEGPGNTCDGAGAGGEEMVNANIAADTTWTKDKIYILETHIFVTGGTLTIEPCTLILGKQGSSLVVTTAGRIKAEGTADGPIVFTSELPDGARSPGDWGGVVLLGKARINVDGGSEQIEGFPASEGSITEYGGNDDGHNCGSLRYVRIEFAGFQLGPDNELNGLTVGGCGSATELDYIQVHQGKDDGIEFFGGTADLKHAVVTQPGDDGIDWDFGWTGRAQFLIVQQGSAAGNYGFECDNNKNANDAQPVSNPQIANATLIGSNAEPGAAGEYQGGILFRRGTAGMVQNAIIAHFADYPIDIADDATVANAQAGKLAVKNAIFWDNANDTDWPADTLTDDGAENDNGFDEGAHFHDAAMNNLFVDPMISDMSLDTPNFMPKAGSPALSGAPAPGGGFDTSATFYGAIGAEDWTAGWTAYPAN